MYADNTIPFKRQGKKYISGTPLFKERHRLGEEREWGKHTFVKRTIKSWKSPLREIGRGGGFDFVMGDIFEVFAGTDNNNSIRFGIQVYLWDKDKLGTPQPCAVPHPARARPAAAASCRAPEASPRRCSRASSAASHAARCGCLQQTLPFSIIRHPPDSS